MEKRINFLQGLVLLVVLAVLMVGSSGCGRITRLESSFDAYKKDMKTVKSNINATTSILETHSSKLQNLEKNQQGIISFTGFDPNDYDPNSRCISITDRLNLLESNFNYVNYKANNTIKTLNDLSSDLISLKNSQKNAVTLTEFDAAMKASMDLEQITFEMSDPNRAILRVSFPLGESELSDYQKERIKEEIEKPRANGFTLEKKYIMTVVKGYFSPRGRTISLASERALSVYSFIYDETNARATDEVKDLVKTFEKNPEILCGGLLRREAVVIFELQPATKIYPPAFVPHIDPNSK